MSAEAERPPTEEERTMPDLFAPAMIEDVSGTPVGFAQERDGELRGAGVLPSSALLVWLREHPRSRLAAWLSKEAVDARLA